MAAELLCLPEYISPGELIDGRAVNQNEWCPSLPEILEKELRWAIGPMTRRRRYALAIVTVTDKVIALMFVEFFRQKKIIWCHDLLVAERWQGQGIGTRLQDWVEAEARRRGCNRLLFESGIDNARAHRFFERRGCRPCSLIFQKDLL